MHICGEIPKMVGNKILCYKNLVAQECTENRCIHMIEALIREELKRANDLHGDFPDDIFKCLAILQEEVGEVTKAVLDFNFKNVPLEDIRKELIQSGAMVIKFLKKLDDFE